MKMEKRGELTQLAFERTGKFYVCPKSTFVIGSFVTLNLQGQRTYSFKSTRRFHRTHAELPHLTFKKRIYFRITSYFDVPMAFDLDVCVTNDMGGFWTS